MINNITKIEKKDCVSCGACYFSCNHQVIFMKESDEGFFYPEVIGNCINCGICLKHCPVNNDDENFCNNLYLYACTNKNKKKLKESTSGGLFIEISTYVLEKKGVVFGCIFDDSLYPRHIKASSIEQVKKMMGSKYVESDLSDSYLQVKEELERNVLTLFVGTPCQIAGLKTYLGKNYVNLLTVDVVCYGVPSRKFFSKYINYLELKFKKKIIEVAFRDKRTGGNFCGARTKVVLNNRKTIVIEGACDPYYSAFYKGEAFREACYRCKYSRNKRSDITIGDFWSLKDFFPKLDYFSGISSCNIHTSKGLQIFDEISPKFNVIDCSSIQKEIEKKENRHPRPNERNILYKKMNFGDYFDNFIPQKFSKFYYLKRYIRLHVPDKFVSFIKKFRNKGDK